MIRRSRAFTLIESAIVLGVMGVIVAGVWAGVEGSRRASKIQFALEQIVSIQHGVRSFYLSKATIPDGDVTTALVSAKMVPQDMIRSGTSLLDHPWAVVSGGGVAISGGPESTNPFTFTITYKSLEKDVCMALAMKASGGSAANGLEAVKIGSSTFADTQLPLALSAVATPCGPVTAEGAPAGSVDVAFRYRLRLPTL